MPNSITLTYFTPHRLTFTGPIPPNTPYSTAIGLSSKIDFPDEIGPLSDEAADAITTVASHLSKTGKQVVTRCNCPPPPPPVKVPVEVLVEVPSPSWSLQRVFTCQRVVGWSAVLGGGYIMCTTLKEGWKAKKEAQERGTTDFEETEDGGRKWWMVLGGGMYVVGVLVLGIEFGDC